MARPLNLHKRVELKIRLFEETLTKLDLICLDPFTSKIAYGERNTHLENALADYFEKHYPAAKPLSLTKEP